MPVLGEFWFKQVSFVNLFDNAFSCLNKYAILSFLKSVTIQNWSKSRSCFMTLGQRLRDSTGYEFTIKLFIVD